MTSERERKKSYFMFHLKREKKSKLKTLPEWHKKKGSFKKKIISKYAYSIYNEWTHKHTHTQSTSTMGEQKKTFTF